MLLPVLATLFVCCGAVMLCSAATGPIREQLGFLAPPAKASVAAEGALVPGQIAPGFHPGSTAVAPLATPATTPIAPGGTPTATPIPQDVQGARINDASLSDQKVLSSDGKTFVSELTFAITVAHYDGIWGEIAGDTSGTHYYPVRCTDTTCTFQVMLSCNMGAQTKMTFHSGIFWRYTTFTLTKPSGCGG